MRKIKLEKAVEFGSRCELNIIDITEGTDKKRGRITVDYAPADVGPLKEKGLTVDEALKEYEERIYGLVKYYISGDWDWIQGKKETMEMIEKHIAPQMEKLK
ncbi:MAG: hypothetical protein PUB75_00335 [Firmicutes bacterium]|nr:hypothetical protein [Bacillota bacterium]